MRWVTCWTALAVLSLFVLPLFAVDEVKKADVDPKAEKKDADKDKSDPKDKEAPKKDEKKKKDDKWVVIGKVNGEITMFDEKANIVEMEVATPVSTVNQGEVQALAQAQAELQRATLKRDANAIAQAMQNIANHQAQQVKVEIKKTKVKYPFVPDGATVRVSTPPVTFDDKGVIKKPTSAELKKLKGDTSLPGYPGDISNLKPGDLVTCTLSRNKDAKPPTPTGRTAGSKAAELDLNDEYQPHIKMIVVVGEAKK